MNQNYQISLAGKMNMYTGEETPQNLMGQNETKIEEESLNKN